MTPSARSFKFPESRSGQGALDVWGNLLFERTSLKSEPLIIIIVLIIIISSSSSSSSSSTAADDAKPAASLQAQNLGESPEGDLSEGRLVAMLGLSEGAEGLRGLGFKGFKV